VIDVKRDDLPQWHESACAADAGRVWRVCREERVRQRGHGYNHVCPRMQQKPTHAAVAAEEEVEREHRHRRGDKRVRQLEHDPAQRGCPFEMSALAQTRPRSRGL